MENSPIEPKGPIFCIYHKDNDGYLSAAIVNKKYPGAEMFPIQHGESFPFDAIKGKHVILVDFALKTVEDWVKMFENVASYEWIDHHNSALSTALKALNLFNLEQHDNSKTTDDLKRNEMFENQISTMKHIPGLRSNGKPSGCALTWKYFENNESPRIVKIVDMMDTFTHGGSGFEKQAMAFSLGSSSYKEANNPKSSFWNTLLEDNEPLLKDEEILQQIDPDKKTESLYYEIVKKGMISVKSMDIQNHNKTNKGAFYCTIKAVPEVKKAICLNGSAPNSFSIQIDNDEDVKIKVLYSFSIDSQNRTQCRMSVYSTDKNLKANLIVKKCLEALNLDDSFNKSEYNSGGHDGAAGCQFPAERFNDVIKIGKHYVKSDTEHKNAEKEFNSADLKEHEKLHMSAMTNSISYTGLIVKGKSESENAIYINSNNHDNFPVKEFKHYTFNNAEQTIDKFILHSIGKSTNNTPIQKISFHAKSNEDVKQMMKEFEIKCNAQNVEILSTENHTIELHPEVDVVKLLGNLIKIKSRPDKTATEMFTKKQASVATKLWLKL